MIKSNLRFVISVAKEYQNQGLPLADLIAEVVGYQGEIFWDSTKPDGTMRKTLNTSKLKELGWKPSLDLRTGIKNTYDWCLANPDRLGN